MIIRLAFATLALLAIASSAIAQECLRWDTPGCIQMRFMAVDAVATHEHALTAANRGRAREAYHYVEGLLDGTFVDSRQVAAAVYNLSSGKGKRGDDIKLVSICASHYVYVWGSNPTYSAGIRESSVAEGRTGTHPVRIGNAPAVMLDRTIPPDEVFRVEMCGGEGALNVPWNYFTSNSFILICSERRATFPRGDATAAQGHHLTSQEVDRSRDQQREFEAGRRKIAPIMLFVTVYGNPMR